MGVIDSMADRSADWLKQAESDLRHARHAQEDGDYDWAAFASHQAAEKAIKAVLQHLELDPWGRALGGLLSSLPESHAAEDTLLNRAWDLDKHFIFARYPDGYDKGAPVDFYTHEDGARAIANAEEIVGFCRSQMDG
jgi:HEPN domain-containing protein